MACYHPLKAFKIGVNPLTGKDKLKVCSYDTDHLEKRSDGKYYPVTYKELSNFHTNITDYVDIPCGKCIGCRLNKSAEWANRCSVELSYFKYNYFVTLTYDDDHLPVSQFNDDETGTACEAYTLRKRDFQLFMKRLRKDYSERYPEQKIRFFCSGEYGDRSLRPHMHAILFNLFIPDLVPYKKNEQGDWYYTSEWLSSFWNKGFVVIGSPDWESIAYTARYVCKKLNGEYSEIYKKFNIEPEFMLCSRRPGIGRQFFEDNKNQMLKQDKFYIPSKSGARPFSLPRYYRDLLYNDLPDDFVEYLKEQNKNVQKAMNELKCKQTDLNYLDMLSVEEYNVIERTKALKREL